MTLATHEKRSKPLGVRPEDTARHIGARLKQIRKSQKVTLMDLGAQTGVDIATISRIENGKMTGTLESHVLLATALGVKVTDLYAGIEEAREKDGVDYQPSGSRSEAYVHEAGKTSIEILTTDVLKKKLMPVLITLEPSGVTQREEARVGTERFLYMLDGTAEVTVGEKTFPLKRGSTLYFDAAIPHQIRNPGKSGAKLLSVTTPAVL